MGSRSRVGSIAGDLESWVTFMLFPMMKLRSVTTPELKCLFAMVKRIKYTLVADIIDYFKNVYKMSGTHRVYLQGHSDCHESWVSRNGQLGLH
jgi:hypothetical protein